MPWNLRIKTVSKAERARGRSTSSWIGNWWGTLWKIKPLSAPSILGSIRGIQCAAEAQSVLDLEQRWRSPR